MGPRSLPRPARDVRRMDHLPAAEGRRQAFLRADRARGRARSRSRAAAAGQPGRGEGRARTPAPLTAAFRRPGWPRRRQPLPGEGQSGGCWPASTASRPSSARTCGPIACTPPTWRASPRWTSGWSASSCARARRIRDRVTGRPRRRSRAGPGPGCWRRSTAASRSHRPGGGFYLNGTRKGTLTRGAASMVYYRDGRVAIGSWGRDVHMTPQVKGVRQNLKLIVDHGQVPASVDVDVQSSWGATLGGGEFVWRSGVGITPRGRIIFVYGPALNVRELADLLQRAGCVRAMQLDINPDWMSFMYYRTGRHPADPDPVNLLPDQVQPPDRSTRSPAGTSPRCSPGDHGTACPADSGRRRPGHPQVPLVRAVAGGRRADRAAPPVAEEPAGLRGAAGGRVAGAPAWPGLRAGRGGRLHRRRERGVLRQRRTRRRARPPASLQAEPPGGGGHAARGARDRDRRGLRRDRGRGRASGSASPACPR